MSAKAFRERKGEPAAVPADGVTQALAAYGIAADAPQPKGNAGGRKVSTAELKPSEQSAGSEPDRLRSLLAAYREAPTPRRLLQLRALAEQAGMERYLEVALEQMAAHGPGSAWHR